MGIPSSTREYVLGAILLRVTLATISQVLASDLDKGKIVGLLKELQTFVLQRL